MRRGNLRTTRCGGRIDTFPTADGRTLYFSGEGLYAGQDVGTVEAAPASGRETARAMLQQERN